MTSPFKSDWIASTAVGAVERVSDRIIDCPAKVIDIVGACGLAAVTAAATATRQNPATCSRRNLNVIFTWVLLRIQDIRTLRPVSVRIIALHRVASYVRCRALSLAQDMSGWIRT